MPRKAEKKKPAKKAAKAAPKGHAMWHHSESEQQDARTNKPQRVDEGGGTPVPHEATYPAGEQATTLTEYTVDADAAADVDKERNERIERERRIPYVPPEMPPGSSPNTKVALFQAGAVQAKEQTDKPTSDDTAEASETEPSE